MAEELIFKGELVGHGGWVTAIATTSENPNVLLTASRDKSVIVWNLKNDGDSLGFAQRSLRGHNHFVSDLAISSDGQFALSGSWDGTLRLWNIATGKCARRFVGHTKDVLSVAFSADNRQIISGSRDRTVKLWNTLGECKLTLSDSNGHSDWVSAVRFPPTANSQVVVSAGWDKVVKVWKNDKFFTLSNDLVGHNGYINTVTISPDGSLCASGGKDGIAMLWDLSEGKQLYSLDAGDIIHALVFSPNRYWLVAATSSAIKVWNLETKALINEFRQPPAGTGKHAQVPYAVSLAWSADGNTLFAGFTDNVVRVYGVTH